MLRDAQLDIPQIPPPADVAQPPADAVRSVPTALAFFSKILTPGSGPDRPGPTDIVTVHYTAWTADGTTIDDSRSRGKPTVWDVSQLMAGLNAGIQLMIAGEKRRLWIPPALAYSWPTKQSVVFDVELLSIAPPPATAAELSAAPADVPRTSSGLAYRVLRPGKEAERPKPMSTVTIHYTAWTSDRRIFDDSVARGEPLTVAVDTVIPGLSEALQRMVVGEKSRFWIPAELAYTTPGPPQTSLMFDVELLAIQRQAAGQPGTIHVQSNSPDAGYLLVQPDGTALSEKEPRVIAGAVPGRYRIKPAKMRSYAIGLVASPADMVLPPGGTLSITITYKPIIQ